MSRGLGKLQRFIKEQVYRAEREYRREIVALRGREKVKPGFDAVDDAVKWFMVFWWDVRRWVEENPDFNRIPYRLSGPSESIEPMEVGPDGPIYFLKISPSLERATKRALHTLVRRGEIVQVRTKPARYLTKEMNKQLDETGKAIAEGFARMAAEQSLPGQPNFDPAA